MSVLLMTATINSGYYGNISTTVTKTEERKKQYEEALTKYIQISRFKKIVFAENSETHLNEEFFLKMAEGYGKQIEFLDQPGNIAQIKALGKSYGEATLILDAFNNSKLIQSEPAIYKVTGRIWIDNINDLINDDTENCFIAHNFKEWVLTSFFKITYNDFWETLSFAPNLCNDNTEDYFWCIEHAYFELLKRTPNPINRFKVYPDMRGINSGSGALYTKTRKQLFVRNIVTKLNLNKYNPNKQFYYPMLSWLEYWRHR